MTSVANLPSRPINEPTWSSETASNKGSAQRQQSGGRSETRFQEPVEDWPPQRDLESRKNGSSPRGRERAGTAQSGPPGIASSKSPMKIMRKPPTGGPEGRLLLLRASVSGPRSGGRRQPPRGPPAFLPRLPLNTPSPSLRSLRDSRPVRPAERRGVSRLPVFGHT